MKVDLTDTEIRHLRIQLQASIDAYKVTMAMHKRAGANQEIMDILDGGLQTMYVLKRKLDKVSYRVN